MRKLLLITLLALISNAFAQNKYAFVANGGKFESGEVEQYIDRATLGVIDLETNEYTVLDTIEVESVQGIEIADVDEGYIYLAAQDSIIAYSFDPATLTATRIAEVPFVSEGGGSIGEIKVSSDYLIAGRSWGTGDGLVVYDRFDLSEVFVSTSVNSSVDDLLLLDDSQLVIVSSDTVSILNLDSFKITFNYPLYDEGSASLSHGNEVGSFMVAIGGYDENWSFVSKSIQYYNENGFVTSNSKLGVTSFVSGDNYGSALGKSDDGNVYTVKFDSEEQIFSLGDTFSTYGSTIVARAPESTAFLSTDFDTYGEVVLNNGADTVGVQVSPEGLVFGEFLNTGIFGFEEIETNTQAYYAHQLQNTNFENCILINTNGALINEYSISSDIQESELVSGIYVLTYINEEGLKESIRVLK